MTSSRVVRRVRFDFTAARSDQWAFPRAFLTLMLNGFTVLGPIVEPFLCREMKAALPRIQDEELRRRARHLIAQEHTHERAHEDAWALFQRTGHSLDLLLRATRWLVDDLVDRVVREVANPRLRGLLGLSAVAGAEHWIATLTVTARHLFIPRWLNHPMVDLLAWHGMEEMEHRAVAFDVYRHLGGGEGLRRLGLLLSTVFFVLLTAMSMTWLLAQRPLRSLLLAPLILVDMLCFLFVVDWMAFRWTVALLRYLHPGFHPSRFSDQGFWADFVSRRVEGVVPLDVHPT
ncbi:MAG: metal-dependent hydrolase [Alphaproteobacteria bacterium]|nr:metal-dependent hydrolase [Polyangiaceae bacterium]MCB9764773.1 metal-dependent hydrolase [Alphaproteobacteria bacterium]